MRECAMLVEAVGHRKSLAVIRYGQVVQPRLPGSPRHRLDVFAAVAFSRVGMGVAAYVLELDQMWQSATLGSLELSVPLAQLGRNFRQAQRLVNVCLGSSRHEGPVVDAKQAVFVQLEPASDGPVAQRDVVRFRSGEVLHRRTPALFGDETKVSLNAAPEADAGLRFSLTEDALDKLVHRESRHHVRVVPSREDVDVARCFSTAPNAADTVEHDRRAFCPQVVEQKGSRLGGIGQQVAAGMLLPLGARSKDELFLLRAQAFQRAHAAVAARGLELLYRLDAELGIQQRHRFWTDALQVEQIENSRREMLEQLPVITRFARLGNLPDLRCQIFADPLNSAQLVFVQICEFLGRVCDCLGRVSIGADLERILVLDFEQIGDLREDARDGEVFHVSTQRNKGAEKSKGQPEGRRSRYGTPGCGPHPR